MKLQKMISQNKKDKRDQTIPYLVNDVVNKNQFQTSSEHDFGIDKEDSKSSMENLRHW